LAEISHPPLHGGRLTATLRRPVAITVLAVVVLAGLGLTLQDATYLNHDIAWVLYSTGQMLHGAVYGRDIIEVNPPLIWFLSMPTVMVSKAFGWPLDTTFRIFSGLLAMGALAYASAALRSAPAGQRAAVILLLAYFLFIGCHRDYGQREYLSLALVLPYLMAAAARMEGGRLNIAGAAVIGIAAGLGLAFKPFFLAVPLLVELALLARCRSLRPLLRPEIAAMAATGLLYGLAVVIVTPDYLTRVVPLIADTFWGFNEDVWTVLGRARFDLVGLAVLLGLHAFGRRSALPTVILAAALGYAFSYLVQFKGYTYHEFPMRVLVALGLILEFLDCMNSKADSRRKGAGTAMACGLALGLALAGNLVLTIEWYRLAIRPEGPLAQETGDMIRLVDRYAAGGTFLAISTHPFPGFPTAIYADAQWAGQSNSTILLPAIVKLRDGAVPADPARLSRMETLARTWFLRDLVDGSPKLILVDDNADRHAIGTLPFDFLAFYLEDPQIRAVWRNYHEAASVDGYRVFLRQEGAP
jgi:hypothetical protein